MIVYTILFNLVVGRLVQAAEFCNWEIFQPRCASNEIIVIENAFFGRKSIGRCLTAEGVSNENSINDQKFVGCYTDVKQRLEQICNGKKHCEIDVSKIKDHSNLCHKWLKFHLDVNYSCLQVVQDSKQCIVAISSGKQFISSYQIAENGCGTKNHPWIIESLVGQRIKISPIHVANDKDNIKTRIHFVTSDQKLSCHTLGTISEKSNGNESFLCLAQKDTRPSKDQYLSNSNSVALINQYEELFFKYILLVEASGCSDLIPPSDAWLKRTENEATIGCYATRLRWKLKCEGQRWIGVIGNCSQSISFKDTSRAAIDEESEKVPIQNLVPIVAIAMMGLVICFLIICVGVVFINRYYAVSKSKFMKKALTLEIPRNEYNNTIPRDQGVSYLIGKENKNNNSSLLDGANNQDTAHYFELEHSLLNCDTLSKV